jgi:hypothetical protein
MAKYYRSSFYCPDDKDVFDFLEGVNAPMKDMLRLLRSFGIYVSGNLGRAKVQEYISLFYLDWETSNRVGDMASLRPSEERSTSREVNFAGDLSNVLDAITSAKTFRAERNREIYSAESVSDTVVEYKVTYIDVESAATRMLQEREKTLNIRFEKTPQGCKVRYENNLRGQQIVENVLGFLENPEGGETRSLDVNTVEIARIPTAEARVEFFKDMMTNIEGLELRDVLNMKMKQLEKIPSTEDEEDDEEEILSEEEIQDTLEKVIFYGRNLFLTSEFQALVNKGFYLGSATWRSEIMEDRDHIEMFAGFDDDGLRFAYKVTGVYRRNSEGDIRAVKEHPSRSLSDQYLNRLETQASKALENVLKKIADPPK